MAGEMSEIYLTLRVATGTTCPADVTVLGNPPQRVHSRASRAGQSYAATCSAMLSPLLPAAGSARPL